MGKDWALITGGSKGIGFELAKIFANSGFSLVLVARNRKALINAKNELEKIRDTKVKIIALDLSNPKSAQNLYTKIHRDKIDIKILINNAGFGNFGEYAKTDLKTEEKEMQLNMITLAQLTKLFLPGMLEHNSGKILNVASTAAFQPGPFMAIYYASKAFVLSFSQALSEELDGTGISVTVLCPGPTRTNFQERAGLTESGFFKYGMMEASEVAKIGYTGMMAGKRIVVPGFKNKFGTKIVRIIPGRVISKFIRKMQETRKGG